MSDLNDEGRKIAETMARAINQGAPAVQAAATRAAAQARIAGDVIDLFRDDARCALGARGARMGGISLRAPLLPPGFVSRAPGEIERGGDASLLGRFRHAVRRHVFERPLNRLAYRVEPFFWRLALRVFDRAERHAERLKQASGETHEFVAR